MTAHVTTSHGADFFGVDTYDAAQLQALAQYTRSLINAADREELSRLLESAGTTPQTIVPAGQAADFSRLLLRMAGHKFLKPKHKVAARLLGDAAARAAADGEPWTWTVAPF